MEKSIWEIINNTWEITNSMKNIASILLLILFVFCSCNLNRNLNNENREIRISNETIKKLKSGYDSFESDGQILNKGLNSRDWISYFKKRIEKENPEMLSLTKDSFEYFNIPALSVNTALFNTTDVDLSSILKYGKIKSKNSLIYVSKNDKLFGILSFDKTFHSEDFSKNLNTVDLSVLRDADFCYKIVISQGRITSFLPGIVYGKKNELRVLGKYGEDYPISEMGKLIDLDEKKFNEYLAKIIK